MNKTQESEKPEFRLELSRNYMDLLFEMIFEEYSYLDNYEDIDLHAKWPKVVAPMNHKLEGLLDEYKLYKESQEAL